jgi:hypothetical protein
MLAVCLSASSITPAFAQEGKGAKLEGVEKEKPRKEEQAPGGNGQELVSKIVKLIVNIRTQRLYGLNYLDEVVLECPVSTGRRGYPTPTGNYKIRLKARSAYSKKYTAWMFYWQAFSPDGGYGLHSLAGRSYLRRLGHPASHGCIRLSHEDAHYLYQVLDVGTPLRVVDEDVELKKFSIDEVEIQPLVEPKSAAEVHF